MAVDLRQTHFRFGKDDGTEAAHTFWQNEDVNHSQFISADWLFLLRFTEQEVGGTAAANTDAQFQYNKNGAGWVNITTTSSVVKAVAVNAFTNGETTSQRLSGTGTFSTTNAGCTEDGSSGGTANDIPASGNSETEAGLQVVFADVANNDTIQFRFTSPDWTITYTITPTLTITKTAIVTGSAAGSGIGLASSLGLLDILAQAQASGIGLASSEAILDILAQAQGSGIGSGSAIGDVLSNIVEGSASGSGIGTSTSTAYLIIPASVLGSGVGESSASSWLLIPASASGSGVGLAEAVAQLITLAQTLGSGVGLGQSSSYIIIPTSASGQGIGLSEALAYLEVTGQAYGEGVGLGSAAGDILVGIIEGLASGSGVGGATIQAILILLARIFTFTDIADTLQFTDVKDGIEFTDVPDGITFTEVYE